MSTERTPIAGGHAVPRALDVLVSATMETLYETGVAVREGRGFEVYCKLPRPDDPHSYPDSVIIVHPAGEEALLNWLLSRKGRRMHVDQPRDIRHGDNDPPCTVCGQPKAKHPDAIENFHPYSAPAGGDLPAPDPAPPAASDPAPPRAD